MLNLELSRAKNFARQTDEWIRSEGDRLGALIADRTTSLADEQRYDDLRRAWRLKHPSEQPAGPTRPLAEARAKGKAPVTSRCFRLAQLKLARRLKETRR
jgi:hypothetical protein